MWNKIFCILYFAVSGTSIRKRRQSPTAPPLSYDVCRDRNPGEYFRLTPEEDCRDVVRCSTQGLLALRCPTGLAFDVEKQTCNWKAAVKNCDIEQSQCAFFSFLVSFNYLLWNHALLNQNRQQ